MGNAPDAAADNWQYLYESHFEADLRAVYASKRSENFHS